MRWKTTTLLLMFWLTACGSDDPQKGESAGVTRAALPQEQVSADLSALLPVDANVLIYARSLEHLEGIAQTIQPLVEMTKGQIPPVDQVMMMTGLDIAMLDKTRPMAVAVKHLKGGPPVLMTYILPVNDVDAALAAAQLPGKSKGNGYVGLSQDATYEPGANSLTSGMPAGDVVIRFDLDNVIQQYRADIDGMLMMGQGLAGGMLAQQAPGTNLASDIATMFDWFRGVIDGAELFDVVVSRDKTVLDTVLAFTVKEDSTMAQSAGGSSKLADLATHITDDFPLSFMFTMDIEALMNWSAGLSKAMAAQLPPDQQAELNKAMEQSLELAKGFGQDWAVGLGAGAGGLQIMSVMRADDAVGMLKKYSEFMTGNSMAAMGMQWKPLGTRESGGATIERYSVLVDAEKYGAATQIRPKDVEMGKQVFFGGDPQLDLAAKGDRMLFVVGGKELTDKVISGGASPALQAVLGRATGDLGFVMRADLRRCVQQIATIAAKMGERAPEIPDGDPVEMSVFGERNGRVFRAVARIDVKTLTQLMSEMK